MSTSPVLVIGAGPAGLAVAAALRQQGVPAVVLERADDVGASWRRHYERLHLHTTRRWSGLPGLPIPHRFGRWVARADVVNYLEKYAEHHRLRRADRRPGQAGRPRGLRQLGGRDRGGGVVHRGDRRRRDRVQPHARAAGLAGRRDVPRRARARLGVPERRAVPRQGRARRRRGQHRREIAVDLTEGGASRVRLAIRTAPHIVRRSNLGWPAQGTGILVRHLPVPVVDRIARPVARVEVPDLSPYGLPRPTTGLLLAREGGLGPAAGRRADRRGAGGDGRAGRGGRVVRRRRGGAGRRLAASPRTWSRGHRLPPRPRGAGRRPRRARRPRAAARARPRTSRSAPGLYFTGSPTRSAACSASCGSTPTRIARRSAAR